MTWEETAEKKRAYVRSQIPSEWILSSIPSVEEARNPTEFLDSVLPEDEKVITSKTLLELKDEIASKKLTSYEITRAFCHRAAIAHQIINCCSEIFFDKALARAKELDEIYSTTGKLIGPLHGLPISLKDQVNLEGFDSSIGFVSLAFKPKTKDEVSVIADILSDAGAVFYVKTCVPMAMMAPDTFTNLYGQTVNSKNRLLSAGGSSGGESSLIGCGGGLIGLSTDIGGSIRIPACFNGLFALRGCTGRLPYCKVTNSAAYQPIVPSVIGPSAKDLTDLEYFVKTIIDSEPWLKDPKCPPIPWRTIDLPKQLCFGILTNNGAITPHPPVQRALRLLKDKLEAAGHIVFEWKHPVPIKTIMDNLNDIYVADGYKEAQKLAGDSGEPIIPQLMAFTDDLPVMNVSQHWEQARLKYETQQAYDSAWMATKEHTGTGRPMDAWISPVWETTSYPAGQCKPYHCSYTYPANYLDYTSVVMPVTTVGEEDNVAADYEPLNSDDKETKELWDYELFKGMPVTVQVHGFRYEEEKTIKMVKEITKVLS